MKNKDNNLFKEDRYENIIVGIIQRFFPFWPLFIITFLISLIIAWSYLKFQTPIYEANAQILLKDSKNNSVQTEVFEEIISNESQKSIENEIEIIKSAKTINNVIDILHLYAPIYAEGKFRDLLTFPSNPITITAEETDKIKDKGAKINFYYKKSKKLIYLNGKPYPLNKFMVTEWGKLKFQISDTARDILESKNFYFLTKSQKSVSNEIISNLRINSNPKQSGLLLLKYSDPVAYRAEKILNEIILSYNNIVIENKNQKALNTLTFLTNRIKIVNAELQEIDKKIQNIKSSGGDQTFPSSEAMYIGNSSEYMKSISDIEIQLIIISEIENYINSKNSDQSYVPGIKDISDPILISLLNDYIDLNKELSIKKINSGDNSPIIVNLNQSRDYKKKEIIDNINSIKNNLKIKLSYLNKQSEINSSIISKLPALQGEIIDLVRQQNIKNNIYTFLLQKQEESEISFAATVSNGLILENAHSGSKPVKPIALSIYLISISIGLSILIVIIIISEDFNEKILFRSQIEAINIRVIAEVMFTKQEDRIVIGEGIRTVIAEQFRSLRTSIMHQLELTNNNIIMLTSSISGEGKSFICVNLATSIALTGKKVLLIELDLRKPKANEILEFQEHKGLTHYLVGKANMDEIIYPIEKIENLSFIPGGTIPPNPTELILNGKLDILIEKLKLEFDYIIIDTPPIGLVTDATILNKYSSLCLYIVRHNYTPKKFLKFIKEQTSSNSLNNINIIFNGLNKRGIVGEKYGYGYGYGYGHGYGYGYGYNNGYTYLEKK